jgi:DNA-binding Xre family transcriptional regulator
MITLMEEWKMGSIRVMVPQLMAEKGINITELAKALGVSRPTAGKLAAGRLPWIRPDQLAKMCEIFNVEVGDILIYRPNGGER